MGKRMTYRGKRDMMIKRKKDSRKYLVEHKTAGRLDAAYISKLPLDSQILGYAMSILEKYGYIPHGVLYNVTLKTKIKQKGSQNFNQFCEELENLYLNEPTKYFYREYVKFTKRDLDNFKAELTRFFKDFNRAIDEKYFYLNTTQCTQYGGCDFMRLCLKGVNQETLSHYRVRKSVHEELENTEEED